jgi:hypothetical protein
MRNARKVFTQRINRGDRIVSSEEGYRNAFARVDRVTLNLGDLYVYVDHNGLSMIVPPALHYPGEIDTLGR